MADAIRVPEPLSSDTDDVTDALDVAQSLWENGKRADAVHWVKRAAESAKTDPTRMALLSRAAEDLERAAVPRPAAPPPGPPPVPAVSKPPPVPKVSKPPPPLPPPRAGASAAPSATPPPPQAAPAPPAPKISVPPAPKISAPPPPMVVARPSKVPPQLLPQPASEDRVRLGPSPSDKTLRVRASMRVSVKTSVRDGSLLVVRPLADGAAVPAGAREALLTFVNDDVEDVEASS